MTQPTRPSDAAKLGDQYKPEATAAAESHEPLELAPEAAGGSGEGGAQNGRRAASAQNDPVSTAVTVTIMFAVAAVIIGTATWNILGLGIKPLTIVTSAIKADSSWMLSGRVLYDAEPIQGRVSVVASSPSGNRFAPPSTPTDSLGFFTFPPIRERLANDSGRSAVSEVTVTARGRKPGDTITVRGEETLRLTTQARTRWVRLPPSILTTIVLIFVISVAVGIWQARTDFGRKMQYYGTIALAFLLTVAVIVAISFGLRYVNLTGADGDVIALGFANIYRGSYVKDLPPEWLFSLTAPWQPASGAPQLARGFGVPLWLLLLAVLGSGLFTIRLVVRQVKTPVDVSKLQDFRDRLQEVVLHQFYIFFAPVGAVFVYQLLVAAGAASVEMTVAIAMLAAGATLNALLDRALLAAQNAVEGRRKSEQTHAEAHQEEKSK